MANKDKKISTSFTTKKKNFPKAVKGFGTKNKLLLEHLSFFIDKSSDTYPDSLLLKIKLNGNPRIFP